MFAVGKMCHMDGAWGAGDVGDVDRAARQPGLWVASRAHGELDGELFLGRGKFQECMTIVRRTDAPDSWRRVQCGCRSPLIGSTATARSGATVAATPARRRYQCWTTCSAGCATPRVRAA